jgi:hypothetical protein
MLLTRVLLQFGRLYETGKKEEEPEMISETCLQYHFLSMGCICACLDIV